MTEPSHRNVMLAAITFNVATSLEPCATHGQPHMGVKSAQELRRMNKSQASHKKNHTKTCIWQLEQLASMGSWSSWEQLREVCCTSQKGGRNCTL
ncbi:unnamed protein product [Prunus armeniaca]